MNQIKNQYRSLYDCIIVGGGMVGAALSLALCKQNKTVLLVEKQLPTKTWLENPPLRVSAVNRFSEDYLRSLNLWPHINEKSKCAFTQLATWEKPEQPLLFDAKDINAEHLGYLIRNEALQIAAYEEFQHINNPPDILSGYQVQSLLSDTSGDKQVDLCLESDQKTITVSANLVIGADGAFSQIRQLSGIGITGWDYQQHCLSITLKTDFPTQDITWQEFQPSGPKAFLPLSDGYSCLIWYDSPELIKQLTNLKPDELKQKILSVFPKLAGDFDVIKQAAFPLTRRQANQYFKHRIVLVGDAAHTINPLAGQGVNLGYKDVAELVQQLESVELTDDQQLDKALTHYQRVRKAESLLMSGAMDSFYALFSNDKPPLKAARTMMLNMASRFEWAKKQVLKKAIGY